MVINDLVALSNRYGSNPALVLAGGGNTSAKLDDILYVKASGTALSSIKAEGFVKMDRAKLNGILQKQYPEDDGEREAAALADLMAARMPGEQDKRPSVETLLHSLFPQTFVLHLHPALVNGLTCAVDGEKKARELFGGEVLWVGLCKPGSILAKICAKAAEAYQKEHGRPVNTLLLQNHGVFIAGNTPEELDSRLNTVLTKLEKQLVEIPDFAPGRETAQTAQIAQKAAELYGPGSAAVYDGNREAMKLSVNRESVRPLMRPFTPDHIVYCKAWPLYIEKAGELENEFRAYLAARGAPPNIVIVKGLGFFALGRGEPRAQTARAVFNDAIKIAVYAKSFGGPLAMTEELTEFIVNWEVEAYRQKQN